MEFSRICIIVIQKHTSNNGCLYPRTVVPCHEFKDISPTTIYIPVGGQCEHNRTTSKSHKSHRRLSSRSAPAGSPTAGPFRLPLSPSQRRSKAAEIIPRYRKLNGSTLAIHFSNICSDGAFLITSQLLLHHHHSGVRFISILVILFSFPLSEHYIRAIMSFPSPLGGGNAPLPQMGNQDPNVRAVNLPLLFLPPSTQLVFPVY